MGLRYPLSKQDRYPGKIVFTAVDDPTYDVTATAASAFQYLESQQQFLSDRARTEVTAAAEFAGGNLLGEFDTTLTSAQRNLTATNPASSKIVRSSPRVGEAITLYLPQAVTIGDGVEYERFDFGALGTVGLNAIQGGASFMQAVKAAATETGKTLYDAARGDFSNMSKDVASLAVVRLATALPVGSTAPAVARAATGVGANPNTKTLFKAVNLRTFSFTFKMIASSSAEAVQIDSIVKYFRKEMYPEEIAGGLGYKFPPKFNIRLSYDGKQVPIKFLDSNLMSMQTTYNPSSMGWHEDGMPSEVDMTLNFGEPRSLKKQDFAAGGELG